MNGEGFDGMLSCMILQLSGKTPLDRYRCFETLDVDEARDIVARHFCNHRLELASADARFDACQNRVAGRHLSLNYLRYGADVSIDPGELADFYLIQIPIAGTAEVANGHQYVSSDTRTATLLNPDRHTKMQWHAGCEQVLLQIERAFVRQIAVRMAGTELGPIRFNAKLDLTQPELARWSRRLRGLFKGAEAGEVFSNKNDRCQDLLEEMLVASLLDSQPNTVSPMLGRTSSGATPAIVKRATEMICERFQEDISLLDISSHSGTTPRNLQLLFKREFGRSPIQYLQSIRLAYARHLLISGSDSLTIAEVADMSGHRHFGRFSVAYRRCFDETPRETRRYQKFR
ncbi:AraC family transcriptional regulator [uncultured Roseibium sp.]|uniref:AraC family transcriptional regulator n=1 Tax=uncultured Roseibium sp. TaxID=1936171 RepID=UPI00260AE581|nr:AraC family transcriptional regulator [uncultured Roseibium sp.]